VKLQRGPLPARPSASSDHPFLWAAGIEDTFISAPHAATGRRLDEYELTEHYDRWESDLELMASLGIGFTRYGIPWYRVNPQAGEFDWAWTDRVIERLVLTHKIEPIIDLVHYGAPLWLKDSFLNPDYPQFVAEFAHAFAERYKGLCYWYTPLNEPRVHSWYAGRLGWWPPYAHGWRGYIRVLLQLCRGICLTQKAITEVEPDSVFVHVDATDLYIPADHSDALLAAEARLRQEIVFLALDLVQGLVGTGYELTGWLSRLGVSEQELSWFQANSITPDVIGINMYPMFSRKIVHRTRSGHVRVRIVPCWTETLSSLTEMYARRYPQMPIMVTETASAGPVSKRVRWIEESAKVLMEARERGVPVIGYTFWPLFSLIAWAYQGGSRDVDDYLIDMGLWDLRRRPDGLERVETPAVEAYRRVVAVR